MPKNTRFSTVVSLTAALLSLVAVCACDRAKPGDVGLKPFGYSITEGPGMLADYTSVFFISDNLLIVVINQRDFTGVPNGILAATGHPLSKVLVVDVMTKRVVRSSGLAIEKAARSAHAMPEKRFAIVDEEGLAICDSYFSCGEHVEGMANLSVSPRGLIIAVAAKQARRQTLLYSGSLEKLASFSVDQYNSVIPGDDEVLLSGMSGWSVWRRDGSISTFYPPPEISLLLAAYISSESLIASVGLPTDRYHAALVTRSGVTRVLASVDSPSAKFFLSADGKRVGISELAYTKWNSIENIFDLDNSRPMNYQRARVFEVSTGHLVSDYEWNPRPHPTLPALSPDGHKMAIVSQGGFLQIWETDRMR